MLAGFSSRSGLILLLSSDEIEKAQMVLEDIATGESMSQAAAKVYGCDPMHVSAMLVSAAGCSADAASGIVPSSSADSISLVKSGEQLRWLSVLALCEALRQGEAEDISERYWEALNLGHPGRRTILMDEVRKLSRRGHGWSWIV